MAAGGIGGESRAALDQFLLRDEPALSRSVAVRRLEAHNQRFDATGRVEACAWLADGVLTYRIVHEEGSRQVIRRVLEKALEGERDASVRGEFARAALTPANYRFDGAAADAAGAGAVRVTITPLRKDRALVNGSLLLAADGDLLRVEGRLAKNPSFWTTRVDVTRTYARVAGVRVPVAFESVATVRIAGRSTFRMTYDYLSLNGQVMSTDPRCA